MSSASYTFDQRVRYEIRALRNVFDINNNSFAKTWGTVLLFVSWAAIYIGTTFTTYPQPEYFGIFTAIVFLVIGRWWGIEFAWQQMGVSLQQEETENSEDE